MIYIFKVLAVPGHRRKPRPPHLRQPEQFRNGAPAMWWIAGFYAEPYSYVVLPRPDSKPANPIIKATLSSGNGLMRPLEAAAKKASVQISIEHKMTGDALVGSEPSLWGLYNQTGEFGYNVTKPGQIGCQYGYRHLQWIA
jgi:hypothetical protein